MLNNKTLLITGGTGSFGNAVLQRFLHTDYFKEIRIFSRDEKKQDDMRRKYKSDKIYVNFGMYGKGANPVNSKDWGRLTVFFTGNKTPTSSNGGRKTDGASDGFDEFLNHGQLTP